MRFKFFFLMILFFFFLTAFYAVDSWTIMIYMNGDNNLEEAAINDFLEISNSNINTNVANILIQFDRIVGYNSNYGDWTDTKRFYVVKGSTPSSENAIEDLGELDMGNGKTLEDFIKWGIDNYPAKQYVVFVWDHGNSWYKNKNYKIKDFSFDETDNDNSIGIANGELRATLSNIYQYLGRKIDLFGIDGCISQTLTLSGEIYEYVNYLIASEDYEPWDGWEYTSPLNDLFLNPNMNAEELGGKFCYYYYESQKMELNNTLSLINLNNFSQFITDFNTLIDDFIKLIPSGSRKIIFNSLKKFEFPSYADNADLGLFLQDMENNSYFTMDVINHLKNTISSYNLMISSAFGYLTTTGDKSTGVTIYFGNNRNYQFSNLSEISLWDDFLFYYNNNSIKYPVYPNPTNGSFTLSGLLNGDEIYIYTIDGKLIFHVKDSKTLDAIFNLENYSNGVYILLVKSVKNGIIYKKIVKVK